MSFGDPKEAISNDVCFNDGRRSVIFPPSVWGDYFLSYDSTTLEEDEVVRKQIAGLKEEVRNMFATAETCSKKLRLIDLVQRLGLSYHYEVEINEIVDQVFHNPCDHVDFDDDLFMVALTFRLLRQQGHFVSCEIFNKFTNEKGAFNESIVKDERGLLSLYEASHLRMNEENILDEALTFTTAHLREIAMNSSSSFGEEVKYALKWPIFKAFPRLMSKHHISLYHNDPLHNNALLTFAKLDYTLLQNLYKKEVAQLTRWMKELKLNEQLLYTRDRIVECYTWALGVFYEPKYSRPRILLAKIINFISALDDTYDIYATLDELESFTNAIERWDINVIEKLPDYMKFLYQVIFNIYMEIEQDICKEYNIPLALDYAKDEMKGLCKAYFMEAKWFHEGYVPSMEEYMKVGTVSSSYYVFCSISFIDLGADDVTSKEVFQWAKSDPMLIKAAGVIGRLMNDITSHKFEQERGHVASAVECYAKQYGESNEDAVVIEVEKLVVKAWKDLTEDYIKSTYQIPNVFLMRVLNLARVSDLFYKKEDGYTLVEGATKSFITSILIDSL